MIDTMKRILGILSLFVMSAAGAADLRGNVSLNITSDTAAAAKNIAMTEARRQIVTDILGQYSDKDALNLVLGEADDNALNALIASTEIDDEQASPTTYSANISMTLDADAVRTWLAEKGVQNWLPDADAANRFAVWAELSSPIANWIELNDIARRENMDVAIKSINGNRVMIDLPMSSRGTFTIAIREGGWHYANMDGALRIWK